MTVYLFSLLFLLDSMTPWEPPSLASLAGGLNSGPLMMLKSGQFQGGVGQVRAQLCSVCRPAQSAVAGSEVTWHISIILTLAGTFHQ